MDEIPTAHRDIEIQPPIKNNSSFLVFVLLSVVAVASIGALYLFRNSKSSQVNADRQSIQPVVDQDTKKQTGNPTIESSSSAQNQDNNLNSEATPNNNNTITNAVPEPIPENILGHLPYQEAPPEELKPITNDGRIRLRKKAAEKFLAMQADARRSGIILVPISGFRSRQQQEYLFFEIKEQRLQDVSKRAEVSAPPGYSEHHTGYAVDIGDGNVPATHLSPKFDQTPAYKWLSINAPKYSFELSFTPENLQGIIYEPWHWRFVGDSDSLETFYKARTLTTPLNQSQHSESN